MKSNKRKTSEFMDRLHLALIQLAVIITNPASAIRTEEDRKQLKTLKKWLIIGTILFVMAIVISALLSSVTIYVDGVPVSGPDAPK